jgi:CMP-N-acetylneuraminic acid synthetase
VDEVVVSTDSVVLRGRCAALGFRCLAAHSVDEYAQHEARMGVLLPCYQESITIVMLQITSPERTTQQVEDALSLYAETVFRHPGKTAAAFSCFVTCGLYWRDSGPSGLTPNYDINDRPRSQDFDPRDTMIYHENGAIYIFGSEALRANPLSRLGADVVVPFVMPYTSSLDIDCYGDLK